MATKSEYTRGDLLQYQPRHTSFVGVDSDGCVFDTMEIKQKECFHTLMVSLWHLEPVEKYLREAAEFVNLYSQTRGANRFHGLVATFDALRRRPEVVALGIDIPKLDSLRNFIASGAPLGNPAIEQTVNATGDHELADVLVWSLAVNQRIAEVVKGIPPYRWVRESLEKMREHSDVIVVSQTPSEALVREWQEHAIDVYVAAIAGQELGTKSEHIEMAMRDRYAPDRVLMIGDALGDLKAARDNNACFYPINPGGEEASWERFLREACDRFLAGTYRGAYEQARVDEFDSLLPAAPPWEQVFG